MPPTLPVQQDYDLSPCNTLQLPARAAYYLPLHSEADLQAVLDDATLQSLPKQVLGGGSNLWLPSHVPGLTLGMRFSGKELRDEDQDSWLVAAAGGENWHDFVQWTLAQGWPGLENLSLIPGTVGASPIQNIGAYGVEIKDYFHSLSAIHLQSGARRDFTLAECKFAYRSSVFKQEEANRWLISEVVFRLPKAWRAKLDYGDIRKLAGDTPTPQAVADAIMHTRRSKLPDPALLANAGSFFHNPQISAAQAEQLQERFPQLVSYVQADGRVKLAAGWLIEQAGWKGKRLGPVGMYEKQALVLVNHGGATSEAVAALVTAVQTDVYQKFGVMLTPEPIRW